MKRIVTVQDISCFGKCSSTVAMPVLSACGIETVLLPTAILSTHTGEFKGYTYLPFEDEMQKIINHWKTLDLVFDAIYVGYIGRPGEVDITEKFISDFRKDGTLIYIDPAMADNGKLYSGIDETYVEKIKNLCRSADIISPNVTEAAILAGCEIRQNYTYDNMKEIAAKLGEITSKTVITGVHHDDGICTYTAENGKITEKIKKPLRNGIFYGAGDLFSSVFVAAYLNGKSLEQAAEDASEFVSICIADMMDEHEKYWYGVNFERHLWRLTKDKN